jgi:hypothetical protein
MRVVTLASLLPAALVAALAAGCKTAPSSTSSSSGTPQASIASNQATPNTATKAAATKGHLAIEKVRLTELFKGTPVVFGLLPDGSLRADVPLQFSLDRIAAGQHDELTRVVISAPADAGTKGTTLPMDRAASVRAYLVGHGLAEARLNLVSAMASATTVRLVVTDAPLP